MVLWFAVASPGTALADTPPCATAAPATCTDADLRAEVLSETPGLADALAAGQTERAAQLLLGWASPRIVWAGSEAVRAPTDGLSVAAIYYTIYLPRSAGAYCGEAADFYDKLLQVFGLTSDVLVFGQEPGGFQHAVVLVALPDGYALFDPTFDGELELADTGQAASVDWILQNWSAPTQISSVTLAHGDLSNRVWLEDQPDRAPLVHRCADDGNATGCSFEFFSTAYADTFTAAGLGTGINAYLALLVDGEWFATDQCGVPQQLVDAHLPLYEAWADPRLPTNASAPAVEGDPVVGGTLSVSLGTWTSASDPIVKWTIDWLRCANGGCQWLARQPTYVVAPQDVNYRLRAVVIASTVWGTVSVSADAALPASEPPSAPDVSTVVMAPSAEPSPSSPVPAPAVPSSPQVSSVAVSARRGVSVRLALSAAATVTVRVVSAGHRIWQAVRALPAGNDRLRLPPHLASGRYRLVVTATDGSGARSEPATMRFRVRRGTA